MSSTLLHQHYDTVSNPLTMKLSIAAALLLSYSASGQTWEPGNFSDGTKLVE